MTPAMLMDLARSLMARDMAEFDLDGQIAKGTADWPIDAQWIEAVRTLLRASGRDVFEAGYTAGLKAAFEISDEIKRGRPA